MRWLTAFALLAIRAYQRWVSPHKGFACAHRVHGGGPSCSVVGARLIRRHGVWNGLPLLRHRLRACGDVHRRHPMHRRSPQRLFSGLTTRQRGDCDLPCDFDACDGSDSSSGGSKRWNCWSCGCDACGSCDWPDRKKKSDERRPGHRALR